MNLRVFIYLILFVLLFACEALADSCKIIFGEKLIEHNALTDQAKAAYKTGLSAEGNYTYDDYSKMFVRVNGRLMSKAHAAGTPHYEESQSLYEQARELLRAAQNEHRECQKRKQLFDDELNTKNDLLDDISSINLGTFNWLTKRGGKGALVANKQFEWSMKRIHELQQDALLLSGMVNKQIEEFPVIPKETKSPEFKRSSSPDPSTTSNKTAFCKSNPKHAECARCTWIGNKDNVVCWND